MMAESRMSQELSCRICSNDLAIHTPKVLDCGHTICLPCANKPVIASDSDNQNLMIICPTCQTVTNLPDSGSGEDLPTNFSLLSIAEAERDLFCQSCNKIATEVCKLNNHRVVKTGEYIQERALQISNTLSELQGLHGGTLDELRIRQELNKGNNDALTDTIEESFKARRKRCSECLQLKMHAGGLCREVNEASREDKLRYEAVSSQLEEAGGILNELQDEAEKIKANVSQSGGSTSSNSLSNVAVLSVNVDSLRERLNEQRAACHSLPNQARLAFSPTGDSEIEFGHLRANREEASSQSGDLMEHL